jgi:hypothetical protein
LQWVLKDQGFIGGRSGNLKSRIDLANNAIYLADGEMFYIDFVKSDGAAIGYPGSDVRILSKDNTFPGSNGKVYVNFENNKIKLTDNPSNSVLYDSNERMIMVEYIGLLTFKYDYSNGNGNENGLGEYKKSFMVFREKWTRK